MADKDEKNKAPEEKLEKKPQKVEPKQEEKKPENNKKEEVKKNSETKPETEKTKEKPEKIEKPNLKTGLKVKVHQKIIEGKKERIQIFEGIILATKGKTPVTKTITVRKMSGTIAVEKIFPLALPTIEKIEVVSKLNTKRSKLYYLRDYKKKIKEEKV